MNITIFRLGILAVFFFLLISPAAAFTAKNLDIVVQDSSDATITFSYELSWFEQAAVLSKIADPAEELAKALRRQFKKNVRVTSVSGNQAQLQVEKFAVVKEKDGQIILITPSLTFTNAKEALQKYWFAPFIVPDFSPDVTRVSFADGYAREFYNVEIIPSVGHVVGTTAG